MTPEVNYISECFRAVRQPLAGGESERYARYYKHVGELLDKLLEKPWLEIKQALVLCDEDTRKFLRGIALGCAIYAVRSGDTKWLVLGLKGLYIEDQINEGDETTVKLTLLANSCAKFNLHLAEISWRIEKEVPDFIDAVLQVPPKTLKEVGYVEGKDPSGQFTYTQMY